ncbi:MAG: LpxL/LpxP family Kdo(2)-lipid IV(A) lauroyl/palmitoleoyl acyltransferase [Rudaea sp.]|uniref:LpxL/LpxP family Kdo(2)-lipid IV(A) lauroyl/palmitoleoyl acyltransferase n=1 Tax=unclassified Rudaea TaxID=2627037 RepID=UPI0010FA1E5F|nr:MULTISPECIES: LpxL/LpxP family Kdo(2)-lipid IV(A) lauroyl/palmitoleoyl acyltransferase [unclassified Rudaea]MBN8886027.1 LpxL/LpxP family Kdo(2)-lipid IV(A) lauroyl/palmitoleoyl acyltransferase [Rudaea sp.]MBR0343796.1 LpxL/LpxP family Kdo(2)-lipid IV(A) lauroyl/palmitoleoyl acyltransferase [Rudaea sp.]
MTSPSPQQPDLHAPRYWPSWLGVGVMRLIACLPYRALYLLGRVLGKLTALLPGERRHVARRNLELCFPELDDDARERLLRATLADLGLMLVEFAFAWMGSDRALGRVPCTVEGLEHLDACRKSGRGVLLVGAHFSHLELCARLVSQRIRIAGMYRVMDNPVFEATVLRARLRYAETMFTKDELLATVKYLRRGGALWYAPDQDMRGKDSVFVPFFGIDAATITATHHLARLSGAAVIPFFHRRLPDGHGYALRLEAPLEDFPTGDAVADTARVNAQIERMVREAPEQYLWVHKRFKSRPPAAPALY